ncbi:MAG: DUF3343 domain-containing protein [Anaerolineae bacterium]|nr:DUF3343 domain-containing protein [Anaerolineae bacterium]
MGEHSVVLFRSSSHALRAEKVLQGAGISVKMIPTPRQLSADCGMSLRFDRADEEQVACVLAEHEVPINGIHAI